MSQTETKVDIWMPLYIGEYLKEAARLTTQQHGAYLLLLMDYWGKGALPDDDRQLCAIARLSLAAWRAMRETIARFFEIEDGAWRHPKLDAQIAEWRIRRERAAERARIAGKARAAKAASSSAQAQRKLSPSSSPGEDEDKTSSLSGRAASAARDGVAAAAPAQKRQAWPGPEAVRDAAVIEMGDEFVRCWLDVTGWRDDPPTIVCGLKLQARQLERSLWRMLAERDIRVVVGDAA